VRKAVFAAASGACFFAIVAVALAVTNTVSYTAKIKEKTKPAAGKPANIGYTGTLDVGTTDGTQPDTAPLTEIFFAKGIITNGKRFPSCKQSDIDGKTTVPAKCKKAVVGTGVATSNAGTPGKPSSITEHLKVTAYNGPKGKQILLAVTNTDGPVGITNRVIPGALGSGGAGFAFKIAFKTPPDLQSQLGIQIALTHFQVTIPATKTVTVKGKKVGYLQLSACPKSKKLPNKATAHFNTDDGSAGGPTMTATNTYACK
jgi:hypothetical protein